MLRLLLCLAAFLPAILAQGGSLDTFDEVLAAVRAGHSITGNFDSSLCEESSVQEPTLASLHFDMWQYTEVDLVVRSVSAIQSFMTPDGAFILAFSFVDADGNAGFDAYQVETVTGLIQANFYAFCTLGTGATFVEGSHQPDTPVTSYDDLMTALTEGRQLMITAVATDCEHSLPPEVVTAEGGSNYYQYYVVSDGSGGEVLILEWPTLSLSENEGETVYLLTRVIVSQSGSTFITANAFNTLTWVDEYPYPEGFQCNLGENVNIYYASGDAIETFGSYAEVEAAFMEGKDLQATVDVTSCTGTIPEGVLAAGAKVLAWVDDEDGDMPGIHFSQSIANLAGDVVIQEFLLGEDGTLQIVATAFNPVDPGDVPDVDAFACDIGVGVTFTAPAYNRVELTSYASVVDGQLSGSKLSAEIVFSQCVDPTGELDLTGLTAGAYFQDVTVLGIGIPEERIFGSAFGLHTDPISVAAYETFGATIDTSNNVLVYPGYWRLNENGEWGNDFGDAVLECTLGEGLKIFGEA